MAQRLKALHHIEDAITDLHMTSSCGLPDMINVFIENEIVRLRNIVRKIESLGTIEDDAK